MGNIIDKVVNTSPAGRREVAEPNFALNSEQAKYFPEEDYKTLPHLKIIAISDTHNLHHKLTIPDGDILIHSGDFTNHSNSKAQVKEFIEWFKEFNHPLKIVICGNHEIAFRRKKYHQVRNLFEQHNIHYLQNSHIKINIADILAKRIGEIEIDENNNIVDNNEEIEKNECDSKKTYLKFYGAPYTPSRGITKMANGFSRLSSKLMTKWEQIEEDTDIVITHVPPYYILDGGMGCDHLLRRIEKLEPKLHIFGHNHGDNGAVRASMGTLFVNAACKINSHKLRDPTLIHYIPSVDYYYIPE